MLLPLVALGFAMDMNTAITQLSQPATWCAGAATLAGTGDARAVAALVDAYDAPVEASKVCLLDAVEQLAKDGAVDRLLAAGDATRALRAMALWGDDRWLPSLEERVADPVTREAAFDALRLQRRDAAWEAASVRLLGHKEPAVRILAASLLAQRRGTAAAVEARQRVEADPAVQAALTAALAPPE